MARTCNITSRKRGIFGGKFEMPAWIMWDWDFVVTYRLYLHAPPPLFKLRRLSMGVEVSGIRLSYSQWVIRFCRISISLCRTSPGAKVNTFESFVVSWWVVRLREWEISLSNFFCSCRFNSPVKPLELRECVYMCSFSEFVSCFLFCFV